MIAKWGKTVTSKLFQTCGINNAVEQDFRFAKTIMECLGKYVLMDWGDTCKDDCELNDNAVFYNNDRVVAKYKTDKGNVFIITECDRSATTILFADEY